jgi:hypothetical protein
MTTRALRVMEEEPTGKHKQPPQFMGLRAMNLSYVRIAKKLMVDKTTLGLHYIDNY